MQDVGVMEVMDSWAKRAQQTLAMVPMKWVMTYNPSSWEQVEEFRN